ncbi:hypothetical protein QA802_11250 [Streptomyces sp. B21-105]|uniref:hypothetical protein n=1 Tax=Streptomyces sp. B21-105 TaxID=3039417 RepID=UPI002FF08632
MTHMSMCPRGRAATHRHAVAQLALLVAQSPFVVRTVRAATHAGAVERSLT